MKHLLLAGAAALALSACATGGGGTDTVGQLETALGAAQAGYTVYCGFEAKASYCTPSNRALVNDAATIAQQAIDTYAEALRTGNATQAMLSQVNALIQNVAHIVADLKSGKR